MPFVIFDLDGILIDSEPIHAQARKMAFDQYGLRFREGDLPFQKGYSRAQIIQFIEEKSKNRVDPNLVYQAKDDFFQQMRDQIPLCEGVAETLAHLHSSGFVLGICSSSQAEFVRYILEKYRLHRFFEAVVTSRDIPHPKPAPDIYFKVLESLSASPKDCVSVEDSKVGVEASLAAGIKAILLSREVEEVDSMFCYPIHSIRQVSVDLIQRILNSSPHRNSQD